MIFGKVKCEILDEKVLIEERFNIKKMKLIAIIKKGEKEYVALCPEVDVVSQGHTIEEALQNLKEAVALHIEVMGFPEGVSDHEPFVTNIEVVEDAKASALVG